MQERTLRVLEFDKILVKLAELATSSLGRGAAYELAPFSEQQQIVSLLQETSEVRSLWSGAHQFPMGGIHDLHEEVSTAAIGRTLTGEDLLRISATLETVGRLRTFIKEHGETYPVLRRSLERLIFLPKLVQAIQAAIGQGGEVLDSASPKLHGLRAQMRTLHNRVKDRLESIVRSTEHQKHLQENIVTLRNGRYVIPVKQEYKGLFPGIVHDQSSSGATLFIEPMVVVEINNQLRQVESDEVDEVHRILTQLSAIVGAVSADIRVDLDILTHLDLTVAKARLSIEMNGVEPVMHDDGKIRLIGARHPLLTGAVVPIDLELGDAFSTLLITGPNTGGKTVSLKTAGLLVLMAQAGMHVPAKIGTELSVFDGVYSDIGDEQSIEQSLSTFSSHMTQIVAILRAADSPRDLVLLDELGAGTDPAEGAALAMSILSTLHQNGVRTIATTHYSELKAFAYNTPGVQNASVEFDLETLRPTYRLMIGTPGHSNAFAISSRLGLSSGIIDRARAILSPEHQKVEELIGQIVADRKSVEVEKQQASILRVRLEKEKHDYEKSIAKFKEEREQLERKAREEARAIVFETRREMEEIIEELRVAPPVEQRKLVNKVRHSLKQSLEKLEEKPEPRHEPDNRQSLQFAVGDQVELTHLGENGVIIAMNGNEAHVQLDKMKVWVARKKLRPAKPKAQIKKVRPSTTGALGQQKAESISTELDLRGKMVEEALMEVDKYLDEAFLAGLEKVWIIHGKGTGALRSAIGEYLRTHHHVKKHRWGDDNEGGMGVTVVDLVH